MPRRRLRSRDWFDRPERPELNALYLERYLNYGLTADELRSGKPIIGIAQTGSDLSPCNRHHLALATRIRDGIFASGGVAIEFPVHPIQESGKRPTAALDRNLAYLGLVEILYGYPIDGVVLTIGCDKTTPACLMAAATTDLPAIALSVGPMLNGWHAGERTGAGTIIWSARNRLAAGEIGFEQFIELASAGTPSVGYCNTMGTAATMNCLTEALGMQLPGKSTIPAPYRERGQAAFETGCRIVELVQEHLTPSRILTREAFLNAIVVNSAIGGSTNAVIHLAAIARHMGVELSLDDWQTFGADVPLLVNLQPAGDFLAEDFHRAGGVPAVVGQLLEQGLIHDDCLTVSGRTIAENNRGRVSRSADVILPFAQPHRTRGGFLVLRGNLCDSAILKASAIDDDFRCRFLSDPDDPNAFEGPAVVFDGPEDYHARIDEPALGVTGESILVMRGTGPLGYPGAGEVVNMRPPAHLIKAGVTSLPCIGDGRQSGTSGSPSILHVSPEAAVGGNLALLRTGDRIRVDLTRCRIDVMLSDDELASRRRLLVQPELPSQTPWQELHRRLTGPLETGAVLESAPSFQKIIATRGPPRDNH